MRHDQDAPSGKEARVERYVGGDPVISYILHTCACLYQRVDTLVRRDISGDFNEIIG